VGKVEEQALLTLRGKGAGAVVRVAGEDYTKVKSGAGYAWQDDSGNLTNSVNLAKKFVEGGGNLAELNPRSPAPSGAQGGLDPLRRHSQAGGAQTAARAGAVAPPSKPLTAAPYTPGKPGRRPGTPPGPRLSPAQKVAAQARQALQAQEGLVVRFDSRLSQLERTYLKQREHLTAKRAEAQADYDNLKAQLAGFAGQ